MLQKPRFGSGHPAELYENCSRLKRERMRESCSLQSQRIPKKMQTLSHAWYCMTLSVGWKYAGGEIFLEKIFNFFFRWPYTVSLWYFFLNTCYKLFLDKITSEKIHFESRDRKKQKRFESKRESLIHCCSVYFTRSVFIQGYKSLTIFRILVLL